MKRALLVSSEGAYLISVFNSKIINFGKSRF